MRGMFPQTIRYVPTAPKKSLALARRIIVRWR
jgi:hypothetical protein